MEGSKLVAFPLVSDRWWEEGENSEGFLEKPGLTNVLLWGREKKEGTGGRGAVNWDNSILFGQVFEGKI